MMNEEKVLNLYENVNHITHEMLLAAQIKDWTQFAKLGSKYHQEVDTLKDYDSVTKLSGPQLDKKFEILKTILKTDRAIRDITEPWMRNLDLLMQSNKVQYKLESNYNNGEY